MGNIYDICVQDSRGGEVKMSEFKNKTLLIVNVASKCGLTPQYVGLQKIFDEFKDRNFLVLGFPCNQFGGQEPEVIKKLVNFVKLTTRLHFLYFLKSR